jgi:murein DD-endopeptidase MepM/ murein hydrolase activator NlpD
MSVVAVFIALGGGAYAAVRANSVGTNIYASDGGKVIWAGKKGNYGYCVIIDHENGYQTYYAHCSKLLVKKGERVYQGQHIAEMGKTGRVTGTHLHFEIRYNGKTQNPLKYVKK